MQDNLITYLDSRTDTFAFIPPTGVEDSIGEVFGENGWLLPRPYKIFFTNEMEPPILGFPVEQSKAGQELQARLEIWVREEAGLGTDSGTGRIRADKAFQAYLAVVMKLAENAMLSNLLADYHAVFWLVHSHHLSRELAAIPRLYAESGRTNGEAAKYRIFARWASNIQEQMNALASRLHPTLDGEELRGLRFFSLLKDNVLILTEANISPNLRELRPFVATHLRHDFQLFRDNVESLSQEASRLMTTDPSFSHAARFFGARENAPVPLGMILRKRFRDFLLDHPTNRVTLDQDDRQIFDRIAARICEFEILNQIRKGIKFLQTERDGDVVSSDGGGLHYSRSTRPIDFGRLGVVDPMVHRFGLMYDISGFSETLTGIAKLGIKGEMNSYRQMLLFQRKIEAITERHRLQFEKFLGDGAFYTTRRALRLIQGAIEIQRFYSRMRKRGFAFDKGLRIALNFGYYRLLPTQRAPNSTERVMEFYGPGIVELSRLTTGKSTKEIEEIETFLVSHGYDPINVHNFFAPLARGVDVVDRDMHAREFYAYVNANGHLVNEGIVASAALIEALSEELDSGKVPLVSIKTPWARYVGFEADLSETAHVGVRMIGKVSLKGLPDLEVVEIVPFTGEAFEVSPIMDAGTLTDEVERGGTGLGGIDSPGGSWETTERPLEREIVICSTTSTDDALIMIGQWDPAENLLLKSIKLDASDLQRLLGVDTPLTQRGVELKKNSLRILYRKMAALENVPTVQLAHFRQRGTFTAFVLGDRVEPL